MKRNLKTSTIIILILTIIALEVGIALYDHNLSLDTIYFAAICIVLLFGTRVSGEKENTSKRGRRKKAVIFWPSILLSIACFAVISYIRVGYVSVPGIIGFSCFVTYGGFVLISILKGKNKM
ncbi:hypothetical protein [Bacillus cereus]|uniref:hypothetical protein n=1 Tax=Bacillus cereus TaxID=1396 RepID=UPI003F52E827